MTGFEFRRGPEVELARVLFGEYEEVAALMQPAEGQSSRWVAASRLYAAARGTEDSAVEGLLADNRAARAFQRRVMTASALYALPEARAASSGAPAARHGEGCKIRIERSRAEPDQFFVVVELSGEGGVAVMPTSLIVCDSEDRCRRFPLPAVRDGIAQLIAEADSDLMRLIGDPTTRVYLQ